MAGRKRERIMADPEKARERRPSFRLSVNAFYQYQALRTSLDNRLKKKKDGSDQVIPDGQNYDMSDEDARYFEHLRDEAAEREAELLRRLETEIMHYPIASWLLSVKGVGPTMAAVIISEFDIHKADTVSKMWSFSGMAPGKDRRVKGQKSTFNGWLRAKLLGVLAGSFLKSNSPYRQYYDDMRHRLESKKWGVESKAPTKKENPRAGHQNRAAMRYMVKMFLSDLYREWRQIEGLPVREPYQVEYLGHVHGDGWGKREPNAIDAALEADADIAPGQVPERLEL